MSVWRVGSKIPVNLYKDDQIAGQCQSPELAAQIVNGMNAGPALLSRILQLEGAAADADQARLEQAVAVTVAQTAAIDLIIAACAEVPAEHLAERIRGIIDAMLSRMREKHG